MRAAIEAAGFGRVSGGVAHSGKARSSRRRQSIASAAVVVALHTTALYALTHSEADQPPTLSVPLTISLIAGDAPKPTPVPKNVTKPKTAPPKPKTPTITQTAPVPPERQEVVPEPEQPTLASAAPSEPPPPAAVTAPRFDAAYLNNPPPAYPRLSRKLGEEGRVLLRVFVTPDGAPREVLLQASSGSSRLDRAAKEAVERWKFSPARQGAQSVGAWVVVPVVFSLSQQS